MARRTHYDQHKQTLDQRLSRMEGQVRGIRQMVAEDRYCLDVVQQLTALIAAARGVVALTVQDHLVATLEEVISAEDADATRRELLDVLQKAFKVL